MVSILHISDFHIIEGAEWNNMRDPLLEETGEERLLYNAAYRR